MDFSPLNLRSKNLFKRCITCNPLSSASCPTCSSNEVCTLNPATCDRCAEYQCVATSESGAMPGLASPAPSHQVPIAPVVAGSVIGGILLIATIVWLIWKFVLKGRRRESVPDWQPAEFPMEKSGPNSFHTAPSMLSNDARSRTSTHTYRSMASTVLTRASNVIQIAFIPGVTTRSSGEPSTTPRTLVPPVPPIPLPTSPLNQSISNSEDLHFHPGQMRQSQFSTGSRDSALRSSVAPSVSDSLARESIASTMYGGNAVAVTPVRPSMINVKSLSSSPHTSTPAVPSPFRSSSSESPSGKSMIVQMPVSREKGDASGMPPSRVRSLRGLKAKAVMIGRSKSSASQNSSASGSTPSLSPDAHPLPTLPEENKLPALPPTRSTSTLQIPGRETERPTSTATDASHSRARNVEDSDDDDEGDISDHERSRRSLIKKDRESAGPFSDSAALPPSPSLSSDPDRIDEVPASPNTAAAKRASHLSPFNDSHETS